MLDQRLDGRERRAPGVVAIVTDAVYPYLMGGKEVLYHHVTAGLAARGVEVHLYTMKWWDGPDDTMVDGVHYHALCKRYDLYTDTRRSIREAVMFSLACMRLVFGRYDLIYADHMPHLQLFSIRVVALVRRVPLVVAWHEVWGRDYWRQYLGRLGAIAAGVEHVTMRLGDHVVTPSEETARKLREHGVRSERVTVVPHGLDLAEIDAAPAATDHYDFVFVGRLLEHKHAEMVVEGVAELRARGLRSTCAIVGDGPERARIVELASSLGVSEDVSMLDNMSEHAEIFGLMKSATVVVLPSVREGYGIVAAEAIACGTPVITTNHPDNHAQHLVADGVTGWLCEPTAEGVSDAMRDALAGGAARRVPSVEARRRRDWDAAVESLIEVFARCTRNSRAR